MALSEEHLGSAELDSNIAREFHFLAAFDLQFGDEVLFILLKELLVDLLGFQELILIAIDPCLHLPITGQGCFPGLLVPVFRFIFYPLVCHLQLLIIDVEQIGVLFGFAAGEVLI